MAIITDEQMKQWSDLIGQAYVTAKDAVGDLTTPGTSYFEIEKLYRYVYNQLPREGVVSGCDLSIAPDTSYARVSSGTVRYEDQNISFSQADVSISMTFQYPFAATSQYGVMIGIRRSDMAQATTAVRTSIDTALTSNSSSIISLTDTTATSQFSLPFTIQVEGEQIEIWALDSNGDGIVSLNYNSGKVVDNHISGSVAYVSKPLHPHVAFGLPVDIAYQSGGDPTTFDYYPPMSEQDYVIIGRGLVDNPNTMTVARTPVLIAIDDTKELIDDPANAIFSDTEMQAIGSSIDMFSSILNYQGGFNTANNAINEFVNWSGNQTGNTFSEYWDDRPFTTNSGYVRGESFWGISRLEFSDQFREAYYDLYSSELLTTLAIFRGDIAGGEVPYGSPPSGLSGTYEVMPTIASGNLSYGQWTYRVSAVFPGGESSASSSFTVSIPSTAGSTNRVILTWNAVVGATSYEVYRVGAEGNTFVEHRLTTSGEVTITTYTDAGLVVGTSVRRGVLLTQKELTTPSQLVVYVPPMEGEFNTFMDGTGLNISDTDADTTTHNEMIVTIQGIRSDGSIGGPHTVTIPKGTSRSTKFAVGLDTDLYVGLNDVTVSAGTEVTLFGGMISFSPYDLITIQNV